MSRIIATIFHQTEVLHWSGHPVLGSVTVQARYHGGNVVSVLAQVVDGDRPNLLGRDWLIKLEVDLGSVQLNT